MHRMSRGLAVVAGAAAVVAAGVSVPTTASAASHARTERVCSATVKAGHAACLAIRQVDPVEPSALHSDAVTPNATPSGYGPSDLRSAYNLTATGSSSQTVAIVDAYDDPNAESDLATYRAQYGLPACTTANGCFKKVNQTGSTTSLPSPRQRLGR